MLIDDDRLIDLTTDFSKHISYAINLLSNCENMMHLVRYASDTQKSGETNNHSTMNYCEN